MRRGASAALLAPFAASLMLSLSGGCGARTGLHGDDAGPTPYVDDELDGGTPQDAAPKACLIDLDCLPDELDLCNPTACIEGKCQNLAPVVCNDSDPCTDDSCDPATGKCFFEAVSFDLDKDGFKGPRPGKKAGEPGSCGDDCDDTSPLAYPGGKELCDGVDNDCNGIIDDEAKFLPVDADPVLISDPQLTKAYAAGLAYSGPKQGYLGSYTGESGNSSNIYNRALGPQGDPGAAITQINSTSGDAIGGPMVWTGDRYGMVWSDRRDGDYEIYFNTFAPDGPKLGPDVRLTKAFGFSVNPSLAWNGSSFFAVWQDDRSDAFEVYARRLSLDAQPLGDEELLASPVGQNQNAEAPSIAASSQGIGVAYRLGDSFDSFILFQAHDAQLTKKGGTTVLAQGNNYIDPTVVANGSQFVVVWGQKQPFKIFGAVVDLNGAVVVPQTELSAADGGSYRKALALPLGDRVIVTYSRQNDDGYELFSRTFSKDLTPQSPQQQLTKRIGDDLGQTLVFGPDGDVGVLFDGKISDAQGLRNGAFFTRLRCDASKP